MAGIWCRPLSGHEQHRSAGTHPDATFFAAILSSLAILIGTPPNIIVLSNREKELGQPLSVFDDALAGLGCVSVGVLFVALIGLRLRPKLAQERDAGKALFKLGTYLVELGVGPESKAVGRSLRDLEDACDEHDEAIASLMGDG